MIHPTSTDLPHRICSFCANRTAPPQLALHFSGAAPGPVAPIGLDLSGALAAQPLLLTDPALALTRARVLAYFAAPGRGVAPGRVVFRFGETDLVTEGDVGLVQQVGSVRPS